MNCAPHIKMSGYINRDGEILNQRSVKIRDFSLTRLLRISILIFAFFVTNPSNVSMFRSTESKSQRHVSLSWSNWKKRIYGERISSTNFGVLSLVKSSKGVEMLILNQNIPLCSNYGDFQEVCHWISRNICHELKMFRSKPFTAYRIIQIVKVTSFILQSCYPHGSLIPSASPHNLLRSIWSLFDQPTFLTDILRLNYFVYPCLELMERVTISGTITSSESSLHFNIFVLLFFIIGALGNMTGAYFTQESIRGLDGTVAAFLGYISAVKPRTVILEYFTIPFTAGDILFFTFTFTLGFNLLGLKPLFGKWKMGVCISWLFGGLLGHVIAERQLHFYKLWWWTY